MPIAAEALKKMGVYDKRKVMGVTTLDVVRHGAQGSGLRAQLGRRLAGSATAAELQVQWTAAAEAVTELDCCRSNSSRRSSRLRELGRGASG